MRDVFDVRHIKPGDKDYPEIMMPVKNKEKYDIFTINDMQCVPLIQVIDHLPVDNKPEWLDTEKWKELLAKKQGPDLDPDTEYEKMSQDFKKKWEEANNRAFEELRKDADNIIKAKEMISNIQVGDVYILHSEDGNDYEIRLFNINECREPSMKYAVDWFYNNKPVNKDVIFIGDEFFIKNINKLEKKEVKR